MCLPTSLRITAAATEKASEFYSKHIFHGAVEATNVDARHAAAVAAIAVLVVHHHHPEQHL